jgi:hypothetical protein
MCGDMIHNTYIDMQVVSVCVWATGHNHACNCRSKSSLLLTNNALNHNLSCLCEFIDQYLNDIDVQRYTPFGR